MGVPPLSDMPLPQSVFEITVMFKTKARNFPRGIGPKSHAVLCIHTITKFYQRYWLKQTMAVCPLCCTDDGTH